MHANPKRPSATTLLLQSNLEPLPTPPAFDAFSLSPISSPSTTTSSTLSPHSAPPCMQDTTNICLRATSFALWRQLQATEALHDHVGR